MKYIFFFSLLKQILLLSFIGVKSVRDFEKAKRKAPQKKRRKSFQNQTKETVKSNNSNRCNNVMTLCCWCGGERVIVIIAINRRSGLILRVCQTQPYSSPFRPLFIRT